MVAEPILQNGLQTSMNLRESIPPLTLQIIPNLPLDRHKLLDLLARVICLVLPDRRLSRLGLSLSVIRGCFCPFLSRRGGKVMRHENAMRETNHLADPDPYADQKGDQDVRNHPPPR